MMNYLMNRKTPKIIDLTYEQYDYQGEQQDSTSKGDILDYQTEKMLMIKQRVKSELRSIFIQHGALDYEISHLAPV